MIVRRYLHNKGFRYRLHDKKLPGKPDLILPKYKAVIFVHGCFWHGHEGCKYYRIPKSNTDYWIEKIEGNILRDQDKQQLLRDMGWRVIVIWECELKQDSEHRCLELIEQITY
ncbi:Very short patch repair protein [compost metagenome]